MTAVWMLGFFGPSAWAATCDLGAGRAGALECLDDPAFGGEAAVVLGWIGEPSDVEALAAHIDDMPGVLTSIARIGGDRAATLVNAHAQDPASPAHVAAIRALPYLGGDGAEALLVEALDHPDAGVQAADSLALFAPGALDDVVQRYRAVTTASEVWSWADSVARFGKPGHDILWADVERWTWPQVTGALPELAQAGDERVLKVIGERLSSRWPDERALAVEALVDFEGDAAVPVLVDALKAATDTEAVEDLAEALLERDPAQRAALEEEVKGAPLDRALGLAEALYPYGTAPELADMRALAEDRGGPLAELLHTNVYIQSWAPGAVPEDALVMARTELEKSADEMDTSGLSLLLRGGQEADRKALFDLARNGAKDVRLMVVSVLGEARGEDVDDLLVELATGQDQELVDASLDALEDADPRTRQRALDGLLAAERPTYVSSYGTRAGWLMAHGGKVGRKVVLDDLRNGTGSERDAAIAAMIEEGAHAQLLAEAKKLDEDGRRRSLVAVLESDRAPDGREWLKDADEEVVVAAIEAFLEASPADALDVLASMASKRKNADDVREAALEAVIELAPADLEQRLQAAMEDGVLLDTAVSGLASLDTPSARAFLADVARNGDDPEVRTAVVGAIRWELAGDREQFELLVDLLADPADDVRSAAYDALGSSGSRAAVDVVLEALKGDDLERAVAAAGVLLDLEGAPAAEQDAQIRKLAKKDDSLGWRLD